MFSITDTIRESLKLAWKHKILWVFALLLASGGSNFNFPSNSSSSSADKPLYNDNKNIQNNSNSSSEININGVEVDGANMSEQDIENSVKVEFGDRFFPTVVKYRGMGEDKFSALTDEFLSKSIGYIIIVAVAFLIVIVFGIGLMLFLRSWAMGALIGGVDDVLNNKKYTLFSLANWGRKSVRQLFKYNLYVTILSFIIVILGLIIPVIMLVIDNVAVQLIGGIALFISVIGIIIFVFLVSFGSTFSLRFIILNGEDYKTAFKNGINTFKKNIGVTVKLALANCLVGYVFMLIVGGILIGLIGGVAMALLPAILSNIAGSLTLTIVFVVVVIGLPVLIGFSILMSGFSGFITTYTIFAYHKLYRYVMGIDKGTANNAIDVFNMPQNPTPSTDINMGEQNAT